VGRERPEAVLPDRAVYFPTLVTCCLSMNFSPSLFSLSLYGLPTPCNYRVVPGDRISSLDLDPRERERGRESGKERARESDRERENVSEGEGGRGREGREVGALGTGTKNRGRDLSSMIIRSRAQNPAVSHSDN